jgi:segregation and condensation protein B
VSKRSGIQYHTDYLLPGAEPISHDLAVVTAPDCASLVEAFVDVPPPEPLSQAALEVLAIVAYEQPVSRADISHIRRTDSSAVVDTLLARDLMPRMRATAAAPGRCAWSLRTHFYDRWAWDPSPIFRRVAG